MQSNACVHHQQMNAIATARHTQRERKTEWWAETGQKQGRNRERERWAETGQKQRVREGEREEKQRAMAGNGDIAIGWVKLAALEGFLSRHEGGFPDWLPAMRCSEHHPGACLGSLSSIFSRSFGRKKEAQSAIAPQATSLPMVPFTPIRGTYAYDVLQRKFKELDVDNQGCISEGDLKTALKGLNLPASEEDVGEFLAKVKDTTHALPVTFENFVSYTIQQENKLVDTFKELDKRKTGYISVADMETALQCYKFRSSSKAVKRMANRFHLRGRKQEFVIDYAHYRDILMISTINDLRDPSRVWERAYIDLGDVDVSFPLSPGTSCKSGIRNHERQKHLVEEHLVAGVIASAVSRTIVAPLERLKLLSMVNPDFTKGGVFNTMEKLWQKDGVRGLFSGNLSNLLRIVPTKVTEFVIYQGLQDFLKKTNEGDATKKECIMMGSIATMSGTLISHPIDTVRIALATQVNEAQKGILRSTQAILDKKGIFGLYKGIVPNMMRVASYAAINFVVYDELIKWHRRRTGPGGELGLPLSICCGVIAGAAAQIVVYPLETVQRRLQACAAQHSSVVYKNVVNTFGLVIQDEGVAALYAGLLPYTLKLVPAAAISILVYEAFQRKMNPKQYATT